MMGKSHCEQCQTVELCEKKPGLVFRLNEIRSNKNSIGKGFRFEDSTSRRIGSSLHCLPVIESGVIASSVAE
jgi:hypothetical protein